jgi:hypothetical protein
MPVNTGLILLAFFAQMVLTFYIYSLVARGRFVALRSNAVDASQYILVEGEPPHLARLTKSLANQFELPVLFYALVLMLVAINRVTIVDVVLAWAFVAARVAHYFVHMRRDDVLLRGRVFGIGLIIVGLLALHGVVIVLAALLA